jgi:hypothetical protein
MFDFGTNRNVAASCGPLDAKGRVTVETAQFVFHPVRIGSVPDTWVTVYSEDMGNTFGPKGFSIGSSLQVSWSK